jgi:hypothetical protein
MSFSVVQVEDTQDTLDLTCMEEVGSDTAVMRLAVEQEATVRRMRI